MCVALTISRWMVLLEAEMIGLKFGHARGTVYDKKELIPRGQRQGSCELKSRTSPSECNIKLDSTIDINHRALSGRFNATKILPVANSVVLMRLE